MFEKIKSKIQNKGVDEVAQEGQSEEDARGYIQDIQEKIANNKHDSLDTQTYINIAYLIGQQWIALDKYTGRLFTPDKEKDSEVRYVANYILPTIRTELAKMTSKKSDFSCIPASGDDDDIQAAHLSIRALDALDYALRLDKVDKEAIYLSLVSPIAFVKPYWDITKGALLSADGTHEGDVNIEVLSIFEVYWDKSVKYWRDSPWGCIKKLRTCEYVKNTYGVDVKPEAGLINANVIDSQLSNLSTLGDSDSHKVDNSVIVYEYWENPSYKFKNGRRITVASDKVLVYQKDIGFGEGDKTERVLPIFPLVHIDIPCKVEGLPSVDNLIPIQRERNKSRSTMIENSILNGCPPWVIEEDSLINDIEGGAGEVIEYRNGKSKPEMATTSSMNADTYKNLEMTNEEINFVSGVNDVSRGQLPSSTISGTALALLKEQDDTKIVVPIQNFEDFKSDYCSYILKIVKFNYDQERTLKIAGENNKWETVAFKGSDLSSTDVRVIKGSSMPKSLSTRAEFTFSLIDKGILNVANDDDRYKIMKMLELGYTDQLYDDYSLYVNQAQQENKIFQEGQPSTVRDFHEHNIHIREHNRFRNTSKYEELPEVMQKYVDNHVFQHMKFLANLTQEESAALDAMPEEQQAQALQQILAQNQQVQAQPQ